MLYQKTLKKEAEFSGIEPFGGCKVNVRLLPAKPNTGIVYRIPLKGVLVDVPVTLSTISANKYTLLALHPTNKAQISNIEHFNATFYAYELDNVIVELERVPSHCYQLMQ